MAPVFRKTRIAPTPSGYLHLGNLLSFSITATLAIKAGASIHLRIDDMDRERVRAAYVQDIFDTLHFMGIPWDEGPENYEQFESRFSQRHRLDLYHEALKHLQGEGMVYACSCSRSDLARGVLCPCREAPIPLDSPDTPWKLRAESMPDFIVRKRDGYPAYQLSSVIDDLHYGIDFIVRGQDLFPSTQAQLYLATLLPENNFGSIQFYHHSLLADQSGEKLSKSAGSTSIQYLRSAGFQPNQIYARLAHILGYEETINDFMELGNRWLKESFA